MLILQVQLTQGFDRNMEQRQFSKKSVIRNILGSSRVQIITIKPKLRDYLRRVA